MLKGEYTPKSTIDELSLSTGNRLMSNWTTDKQMDSKAVRGGLRRPQCEKSAMILKARTKVCRGILEKERNRREGEDCFTIVTPSERERHS